MHDFHSAPNPHLQQLSMWPRAVFWLTAQVSMVIGFKDNAWNFVLKRNIAVRCICGSALLMIHYGSPAQHKV
jgi:hypothetical protein